MGTVPILGGTMFKKPIFWIVFTLIFIGSVIFTFKYFSSAYPIVTLDLKMDRQTALQSAQDLANKHDWEPEDFKQAASFKLDRMVQNFVELESGGTEAFAKMLEEGLYSPYTWRVRHFNEGETNETLIRFTPSGQPYGFVEKLPEDEPGASLTADSAQVIAETTTEEKWKIDLTAYELVEQSQEVRPGGRTDHTFVYERLDVQIGEGRYRLSLVVGGDKLTELVHFIKIPEAFLRRYEEMRSANNTIANTAIIAGVVLYIIGGCIVGLFFLLRQHWVIWRKPLFWGLFVAFIQVLASINHWPLAWMDYDTALSAQGFLLQQIMQLLLIFVGFGLLLTVSFMAAESLTRKAFPHHVQMWRLWSSDVASSPAILGRTISGYLAVSLFFAFDIALYFFATKVLGWWTPSEALFEPDVLATYFPWLTSIAISLRAGFMEECLFRAIPIAGAALLGQRFGHRRTWIISAFIIQALIFGAGHANYPQQPAYARVVELIIPSLAFGLIYLYFGLLPAIVLHFAVDVVWIALPLFVSSAPGIWVNQALVIILTLVPLWVIVWARLRTKQWREVKEEHYNRSWYPPEKAEVEPEPKEIKVAEIPAFSSRTSRLLLVGGILGLVIWFFATNFQNYALSLTIGRNDVKKLARNTLTEHGIELSDSWKLLSCVETPLEQDDRFIWQTGGREKYKVLIGSYLLSPHWKIRFVQFEGDVAERAEEYQVFIAKEGEVLRFRHKLPEARAGASLAEDEAREIAHSVLSEKYQLDPSKMKEVSAEPSKLPERKDWLFTFADTLNYPLKEGEARIAVQISGDKVVDSYRYIHVPEEWARQERNQRNLIRVFQVFSGTIMFLIFLAGVIGAIISWSRKKFSVSVFLSFFALLFGLGIINLINKWPSTIAKFSTTEPLLNQIFAAIAFPIVGILFISAGPALVLGFIQTWKTLRSHMNSIWLGFSLGALIAGLSACISALFEPSLEPFWAKYSALSSFIPILGVGFNPLTGYIIGTTLFLLIFTAIARFSKGWTQRKILFSILLILLIFIITGASVNSLRFWLFSGLLTGIIYLLAYLFVFRFQLALVPLALGSVAVLGELKQGILNAHPSAIPGAILAIILIVLISIYWHNKLLK